MIEEGQVAHVQRQRAAGAFLFDHDGDRAALDAFAEADAAAVPK